MKYTIKPADNRPTSEIIRELKNEVENLKSQIKPLLCPTCNKGGLYTHNGYIWCNNKKCEAIFEQQDT